MGDFIPTVDVTETEGDIRVAAELPGLSREDIHVEVEDYMLTISGEKRMDKEEEAGNRVWRESTHGSFPREVQMPDSVQPDKAKASFRDGILRVTVPRSEDSRTRRRSVPIQSA